MLLISRVSASWKHKIFVDGVNGVDSESCLQGDLPCATFNMALKGLKYSSTVIYVSPGTYTLEYGIENIINGKDEIAIIGTNKNALINCNPLAGLTFFSSRNIVIENITFHGCGRIDVYDYKVTLLETHPGISTFFMCYYFQAALVFDFSHNISVTNVSFLLSNGSGLLFMNVNGNLTVKNSLITDSKAPLPIIPNLRAQYLIGGGIIILAHSIESGTNYLISKTKIINNVFEINKSHINCLLDYDVGGITLLLDVGTTVTVDSCSVNNNTKGLFVLNAGNSTVKIRNTELISNWVSNIVKSKSSKSFALWLSNVSISHSLLTVFDSMNNLTTAVTPELHRISNDQVQISTIFSAKNLDSFPKAINFEKSTCLSKLFAIKPHPGLCSTNCETYTSYCPMSYSLCYNEFFCSCIFGHTGRLCGRCKEGYSIAINSHYLECVPCNEMKSVVIGWAALIGLEFIPLTVMVAGIAILNVNLNQGSLNAYIFFCQILTIPFPSVGNPAWLVTNLNFEFRLLSDILLIPLSIWNLNFINFPSYYDDEKSAHFSICISSNTTPLGALSFWYVVAFYPLVLLMLLYGVIALYDKGCRCIVCCVRPFHCLLARFWRMFNIHPSLTHTVASVHILCFTQLDAISLKILHPAWYHNGYSENVTVFFYDGTQQYFKGWHAVAGSFAILVLLFLIVSSVYLSIYPFQWFQKCFNKLKFKKDFLVSVTDVFTGPYKDGTQQNSWDYRYFAGLHFTIRLVIMLCYYIPQYKHNSFLIPILEIFVCVFTATTILIFRPYKRNIHSFNEVLLFILLGVFSCYFSFRNALNKSQEFYSNFWYKALVLPMIGMVVVFVVIPYFFYWMIRKCQTKCRYSSYYNTSSFVHYHRETSYNQICDVVPDRLLNPERYSNLR